MSDECQLIQIPSGSVGECSTKPPDAHTREIYRQSAETHKCRFGHAVVLSLLNGWDALELKLARVREVLAHPALHGRQCQVCDSPLNNNHTDPDLWGTWILNPDSTVAYYHAGCLRDKNAVTSKALNECRMVLIREHECKKALRQPPSTVNDCTLVLVEDALGVPRSYPDPLA